MSVFAVMRGPVGAAIITRLNDPQFGGKAISA